MQLMDARGSREISTLSFQRKGEVGASLIEILVSVVIASIGLLALAGVNASSVRYGKLTQYRATASQLASDLGERLRANKAGFIAGNYDYEVTFANQMASPPSTPGNLCNSLASPCTAGQLATVDLWQWRTSVSEVLPQGAVFLKRDATPVAADLWVAWLDPSVANSDERPGTATECPDGLERSGNTAIRCMYFRVGL
ncbi:MAG: type IV pilus modification protein PilV [Ramlibacter sp.]|nr:type IV pilus modification protein PilV [Ramlibacter sp.]MCW5648812.1 type IV pilus modification protein PilV [Ramlibacter sp.]